MRDWVNEESIPMLQWRDVPCSKQIYEFILMDFLNPTETEWQNTMYYNFKAQCMKDYNSMDVFKDSTYLLSIPVKSLKGAWERYSRKDKPKFNTTKIYALLLRFKRPKLKKMSICYAKVMDEKDKSL